MTDHVALHAVVRIVPYLFPPPDVSCAREVVNIEAGPVQTTCGASLEANVALVKHNAAVAAEIATALAALPTLGTEEN